jgi:putative two-component system response regulator
MNNETVLIVEDNQPLRDGIRDILEWDGYTVLTASNGKEGLDQMRVLCPDMILSDISMPMMDGFTFFRYVRARPDWVSIPFVFLTAHSNKEEVLSGKNLGVEDYLVKPLTRQEILAAVRGRLERSQQLRLAQIRQAYETSLTALANAIDLRDPTTRGHVERVTAYSQEIAIELSWPEHYLEQLRFGAILHDIGKIIIRETMLFKPGPLSADEWDKIKKHPVTGTEMVRDIPYLSQAIPMIHHHHERWDGQGYPDGLSGDQIPLAARILSVADGFDAITTDHSYQPARTLLEAYDEIVRNAGTQFDPQVVSAFQRAWDAGRIQSIRAAWEDNR